MVWAGGFPDLIFELGIYYGVFPRSNKRSSSIKRPPPGLKYQTSPSSELAWISDDYLESFLLSQLLKE